jgi:translation elongation factor EF-G
MAQDPNETNSVDGREAIQAAVSEIEAQVMQIKKLKRAAAKQTFKDRDTLNAILEAIREHFTAPIDRDDTEWARCSRKLLERIEADVKKTIAKDVR